MRKRHCSSRAWSAVRIPSVTYLFRGFPTDLRSRARSWRERLRGILVDDSEARGLKLLREWLSATQRAQFDVDGHFEVIGCHTGKRYRIHQGTYMNVHEIDAAGHPLICWCFFPDDYHLARGDVMLAQKIALETDELVALAVANKFPIGDTNPHTPERR
jgi:hypothetical protein